MPHIDTTKRDQIRELNDAFRKSLVPDLGHLVFSAGVSSLPHDVRAMACIKTTSFEAFSEDNDPYGEHDFGSFEVEGNRFFFKIDYYDSKLESGSEDPTDPEKTKRVLTLMLAEEY